MTLNGAEGIVNTTCLFLAHNPQVPKQNHDCSNEPNAQTVVVSKWVSTPLATSAAGCLAGSHFAL